jgi:hypothetical protein
VPPLVQPASSRWTACPPPTPLSPQRPPLRPDLKLNPTQWTKPLLAP